jgi:alkylhydroperoxidase family enzyme
MLGEKCRCSQSERAALAWVEAVTLVADSHVPDEVYEEVRKQFSEKELVDLTVAVVTINGWNRISIATRAQPQIKAAMAAA